MKKVINCKKAITKVQAIILVAIVIIAAVGVAAYLLWVQEPKVTITHVVITGERHELTPETYAVEFEEETGIHVEVVAMEWATLHDKLIMDFQAQTGSYDVINFDGWWAAEMLAAEYMSPTSELFAYDWYDEAEFDWDDFVERNVNYYCDWEGTLYGVPYISDINILWYRSDLFDEYGVTPPPAPPDYWTWDEFLVAAEALNHPEDDVYGFSPIAKRGCNNVFVYVTFLDSLGGSLLTEDLYPGFNNPQGKQALETFREANKYAPPGFAEFDTEECMGSFLKGQTAMSMMPQFVGMAVEDPSVSQVVGKVKSAIVPGGTPTLGGWSIQVNRWSKHKEAAWKWIYFLKSKEKDKQAIIDGFQVGVRTSMFTDNAVIAKYPHLEIVHKGLPGATTSGMFTSIPESNELWDIASIRISEVLAGVKDVDTGLADMESDFLDLLEDKGYIS